MVGVCHPHPSSHRCGDCQWRRTQLSSLWLHHVYHGDGSMSTQVCSARNPAFIRGREAQLHESTSVHGAHCSGGSLTCNFDTGTQCVRHHSCIGSQGCTHPLLVDCQFRHGLLCQPHQLLGHQAHKCLDLASVGQCQGSCCCGGINSPLPQPCLSGRNGGLYSHCLWRRPVQ